MKKYYKIFRIDTPTVEVCADREWKTYDLEQKCLIPDVEVYETEEEAEKYLNDYFDNFPERAKNEEYVIVKCYKIEEYPKTYEECCKVLGVNPDNFLSIRNLYRDDGDEESTDYERDLLGKFDSLWELIICRDAYWKIAGEMMGLGKPWKPDWNDEKQDKYGFYNEVKYTIINSAIFVFPTAEMRDAFYENFKEIIESCKEFL